MTARKLDYSIFTFLIAFGILAPFLFPNFVTQIAVMWMMILFASSWDTAGGQMGYNSLGNITFFGVGMYISAVVQVGMFYDVAEYTASFGAIKPVFTDAQYYKGLVFGLAAAGVGAALISIPIGLCVLGLRGPYFAIGTLGVAVAVAELVSAWSYVGAGAGISMPVYPGPAGEGSLVFYSLMFVLTIGCLFFLRWLYSTQFGLAINAIRDDEDKAEAMGVHTTLYKSTAWAFAAFFLGISGAIFGNMIGFIEPLEVAFPTATFGIFMVAMSLLGGKGTLWGPVIGAILFHIVKELTWSYMEGMQWIALGAIIIVNIVYFQQGLLGWASDRWPAAFGLIVDKSMTADDRDGDAREAAE